MDHREGRFGSSGEVAHGLESVLAAVAASADEIAEGELLKMAESCGAFPAGMRPYSPHRLRAAVGAVLEASAA